MHAFGAMNLRTSIATPPTPGSRLEGTRNTVNRLAVLTALDFIALKTGDRAEYDPRARMRGHRFSGNTLGGREIRWPMRSREDFGAWRLLIRKSLHVTNAYL